MKNSLSLVRQSGSKIAAMATVVYATMFAAAVQAQTATDGITAALDAVDLSGVATKVGAAALLIVGIALVFKGPDIAKRIVRKV